MKLQNINITLEEVYDKYAGLMYGCIYRLVSKKAIAEQILKQIFLDLHTNSEYKTLDINNKFWYTKYAVQTTITFLKKTSSNSPTDIASILQNTGMGNAVTKSPLA